MLLESIRVEDGKGPLLALHQDRMNRARKALYPKTPIIKLADLLKKQPPPDRSLYKLRIEYKDRIVKAEYLPYQLKPVRTIKLLRADDVTYDRKFADRTAINELFARRGSADDILMTKHGYLMDASYANIALYDGHHWYTPSYPMLRGVRREALLRTGTIRKAIIRDRDLANFKRLRLINAMLEWGKGPEILVHEGVLF